MLAGFMDISRRIIEIIILIIIELLAFLEVITGEKFNNYKMFTFALFCC